MQQWSRSHFLAWAAWANVVLHVIGLAAAGLGIRPGTAHATVAGRMDYLGQGPLAWRGAWAVWMLCAVALVTFLAVVTGRLEAAPATWPAARARLARLGLTVAVAGAAFDLFCDSVYIAVFPTLASDRSVPAALFLAVERMMGVASLVIANGAYAVATLLVSAALRGRVGPVTTAVGLAVGGFGLLLSVAGYTGVAWHAEAATGPTIGLFCVWVVLVARALGPAPAAGATGAEPDGGRI